jgi:hypothetical protein
MHDIMFVEMSAVSSTLLKLVGIPVVAGAAAAGLGFLFLWPRSAREAASRFACALIACAVAGPCLVIAVYCWWPALFASAGQVAGLMGGPAELGVLVVAAPILVLAGLPAWWILGALMLWFDRRRSKDIAEIAHDAAEAVRSVRNSL